MYVQASLNCAENAKVTERAFFYPLELATAPFEMCSIDYVGPLCSESSSGNKFIVVICEKFSRWVVLIPALYVKVVTSAEI